MTEEEFKAALEAAFEAGEAYERSHGDRYEPSFATWWDDYREQALTMHVSMKR